MNLRKIILALALVLSTAFLYAQSEQKPQQQSQSPQNLQEQSTGQQTPETAVLTPSFANVTLSEITKKENDISSLLDQLNEKNIQINIAPGGKAKKALQADADQLLQQLQQEMNEYAMMVNSYNKIIAKELQSLDSKGPSPDTLTESEIRNKETEIHELVSQINKKITELNRATNDAEKTSLASEIEMMQSEFLSKKASYLKLVNAYNIQLQNKMNLKQQ